MVLKPEPGVKAEITRKNLKPLIEDILAADNKEPLYPPESSEKISQTKNNAPEVALEIAAPKKNPQILAKEIPDKNDKEKEKCFINYYKLINEQLRQSIIYPQYFTDGEISVSFVLSCDGNLMSVEIMPEISTNNTVLRETALQIVKNASPFPPFPDSLQKKQLTFNVVIYFRERS